MQTKMLSSLLGREVKGHGVYYPLCIKKKKSKQKGKSSIVQLAAEIHSQKGKTIHLVNGYHGGK